MEHNDRKELQCSNRRVVECIRVLLVVSSEVRAGATLLSANANLIRPIGQDSWRMEVEPSSLPARLSSSACLTQPEPSLSNHIHL